MLVSHWTHSGRGSRRENFCQQCCLCHERCFLITDVLWPSSNDQHHSFTHTHTKQQLELCNLEKNRWRNYVYSKQLNNKKERVRSDWEERKSERKVLRCLALSALWQWVSAAVLWQRLVNAAQFLRRVSCRVCYSTFIHQHKHLCTQFIRDLIRLDNIIHLAKQVCQKHVDC